MPMPTGSTLRDAMAWVEEVFDINQLLGPLDAQGISYNAVPGAADAGRRRATLSSWISSFAEPSDVVETEGGLYSRTFSGVRYYIVIDPTQNFTRDTLTGWSFQKAGAGADGAWHDHTQPNSADVLNRIERDRLYPTTTPAPATGLPNPVQPAPVIPLEPQPMPPITTPLVPQEPQRVYIVTDWGPGIGVKVHTAVTTGVGDATDAKEFPGEDALESWQGTNRMGQPLLEAQTPEQAYDWQYGRVRMPLGRIVSAPGPAPGAGPFGGPYASETDWQTLAMYGVGALLALRLLRR